jgi:hypothetical protein
MSTKPNGLNYSFNYRPDTIPRLNEIYTYPGANLFAAKTYPTLQSAVGGNIYYNVGERNIKEFFSAPVFMNKAEIIAKPYTDPMGSFRPQYERIQKENNNLGQLTWIQDSNEWREDLMARQQRKRNESEYEPRWRVY